MALTKATQNVISPNICTTDTAQTITGVKTISNDTLINGLTVGKGGGNIASNTASGVAALAANTTGNNNTAVGANALISNTTASNNTALGYSTLAQNVTGDHNTAVGYDALDANTGNYNTGVGSVALQANTTGINNTAVGYAALDANTTASNNTAVGYGSLTDNTTGTSNTALGYGSLAYNTTANYNTGVGNAALNVNTTGINNTAVGYSALTSNTTASNNTAVGYGSLNDNITGGSNTALGYGSLANNTTGNNNTAVGWSTLSIGNYTNTTGLGYNAQVSGNNQVRIGDSSVTSVTCQTNAWSDERDKADIRDTVLGLEFVASLRPVDFKWDFREDYRAKAPKVPEQNATEEEKAAYKIAKTQWEEDAKWANLVHDGTHKRTRFHHGLIAQEVKALIEQSGVDFGGVQDHTVAGGDAVMTIGYTELIGPMIKAIQELSAKVAELEAK